VAVHLFGSFAAGSATPRSDADIIVETEEKHSDLADFSGRTFENALVPVELFLLTPSELQKAGGIAAEARREGIVLAQR
jgi:predicted nucleotidyltransferase